jgi:hypothetical protein
MSPVSGFGGSVSFAGVAAGSFAGVETASVNSPSSLLALPLLASVVLVSSLPGIPKSPESSSISSGPPILKLELDTVLEPIGLGLNPLPSGPLSEGLRIGLGIILGLPCSSRSIFLSIVSTVFLTTPVVFTTSLVSVGDCSSSGSGIVVVGVPKPCVWD